MQTILESLENILGVAPDSTLEYLGGLVVLCIVLSYVFRWLLAWNKN